MVLATVRVVFCAAALFGSAVAVPYVEARDKTWSPDRSHHGHWSAGSVSPWWYGRPSAASSASAIASTAPATTDKATSSAASVAISASLSSVTKSVSTAASASSVSSSSAASHSATSSSAALSTAPTSTALPIVDLGYELHQASGFNATGGYYNFSNIRYAAPPVGNLRFRAPVAPAVNRSVVQTGDQARICIQAFPPWFYIAEQWIPNYLTGKPLNVTQAQIDAYNTTQSASTVPPQDPTATEDCLFLDVFVPQSIFAKAGSGSGAPVLVWIYGGGYTAGSKTGSGNPAGLILRSEDSGSEGVIFVALNYRLGAFGWLPGVDVEADGKSNAGLYDQRFALEWVQANIAKFGGDPKRVTVFGESAGGGSIMHQITAYGGQKGPVPFQQAVPQSPGFQPITSNYAQQSTFNRFLNLTGAANLAELRALPSQTLITANSIQVDESMYGAFVYGPVVDGDFVPALPGQLLLQGEYDKSLHVMTGHNSDEGLLFTSPFIQTQADFITFLQLEFPTIQQGAIEYITEVLYPPVYDGTYGYTDAIGRNSLFHSEIFFSCNTNYLARAYNNQTYGYLFAVPPGLHGQDIAYSFYNGPSPSITNDTIAIVLQDYITSFAETGKPVAADDAAAPPFTMYGSSAMVQELGQTSITRVVDPAANARCYWLQKALYT